MKIFPPRLAVGTMGYSYEDWRGLFYPAGAKAGDYLSFYARYFDAVELDTTFHAAPPVDRVKKWADAVPAGFRFAVKTPRDVTHEHALAEGVGPMRHFLKTCEAFGDKLAVVLLQFGPTFAADQFAGLRKFIDELPDDFRYAVEFRHASWENGRTADLLRRRRIARVAAQYEGPPRPVVQTADFAYLRFVGRHGRYPTTDQERYDPTPQLLVWKDRIAPAVGRHAVFAFFNNDYAGFSIATANRFKRLLGLQVKEPPKPRQGELFG